MATDSDIASAARRMRAAEVLHAKLLAERRPWYELCAASRAADAARSAIRAAIDAETKAETKAQTPGA